MAKHIKITDQARYSLNGVLSGEIPAMGNKGRKDFYVSFKSLKQLLPSNPLMGPQESLLPDKYRSIVLHPFVKMIYSIDGENIYIHDFWNTLRKPEYLVSRIKL